MAERKRTQYLLCSCASVVLTKRPVPEFRLESSTREHLRSGEMLWLRACVCELIACATRPVFYVWYTGAWQNQLMSVQKYACACQYHHSHGCTYYRCSYSLHVIPYPNKAMVIALAVAPRPLCPWRHFSPDRREITTIILVFPVWVSRILICDSALREPETR